MIRTSELGDPTSCLNRAADDEPLFVLRAKDRCAPGAIRAWCAARVIKGKNTEDDQQIRQALAIAEAMETWRGAGRLGEQG